MGQASLTQLPLQKRIRVDALAADQYVCRSAAKRFIFRAAACSVAAASCSHDCRDRDEQADGGHDQCLADRPGDLLDAGLPDTAIRCNAL